jgi:RHS repeat-associated protein
MLPFAFAYDSSGVDHVIPAAGGGGGVWTSNQAVLSQGGWSYTAPLLSSIYNTQTWPKPGGGNYVCNFLTNYMFADAGGGRHGLGLSYLYPSGNNDCQHVNPPPVAWYSSYPCSDDVYQGSMSGLEPITVVDRDGTIYSFPTPGDTNLGAIVGGGALPSLIEDRNGNQLTVTALANAGFKYTDTVGRGQGSASPALSASSFGSASGDTITVSGLTGPYTVYWGSANVNMPRPNVKQVGSDPYCNGISAYATTHPVVTSIVLPNSQSYTFQYESTYGLLSKVIYPTGGYVRYVWGINPLGEFASFPDTNGGANGCQYEYDSMAVAHRYVSFNGQTEVLEQDFSYTTNWSGAGWNTKQTTVTTKDLARGITIGVTTYTYVPGNFNAPPNVNTSVGEPLPLEGTIVYQDGGGNTLRTVNKSWFMPDEMLCQSTAQNGLTSRIDYTYGSGAQVTDKKEWDWGQQTACPTPYSAPSGTPKRETKVTYQTFGDTPLFPNGAPIYDRPSSVTTYDSGTERAQRTYTYDGSGLASSGVGTGHDSAYSASMLVRGNATQNNEWVNTTGGYLTTSYAYDDTGQTVSMTDPKENQTKYFHNDAYASGCGSPPANTNAYLTEIQDAMGFTQTFTYRYCDGQLASATDRNSKSTIYSYADSLARLTEISDPDGGTITNTYNDGSPTSSIVTSQTVDSATTYMTTQLFDGAGHVTRSQLNSDPDCSGADNTDTAYDGLGRAWTVSNPYCSAAPDPHSTGTTTYTYDALGRVTSAAAPDGSPTSTTYSVNCSANPGDCSTVTDPAGKTRQLWTDGLGRLTSVVENPGGLGYLTTYSYNALDDLLTVNQGSQTRTFVYDSLSRLTSATNPESGTTTYTYSTPSSVCSGDPSSPCTRTDARGITTYYNKAWNGSSCPYDALNRLVCKSYSDGTPTAQFSYDQSSVTLGTWASPSLLNTKGRLTETQTFNSSGATVTGTAQDYDSMGRTADFYQYSSASNCGSSPVCSSNYQYEYTGEVKQWTHPAGYTFTNKVSGARRMQQIASSWVDNQHPQYLAQSITYMPWGAVSKFVNGSAGSSGAPATETYMYDDRLQPWVIQLTAGTQQTTAQCLVYNYYANPNWTPPSSCPTSSQLPPTGTTDNGNVMNYWDEDNVVTSNCHWTAYSYDAVNRLSGAVATPCASGDESYNFPYIYTSDNSTGQDGNMSCVFNGQIAGCSNFSFSATTNQITSAGYTYDQAGNLTKDSSNSSPHTYQWDAEGRVASVDSGNTWSFTYNALGQRVLWSYPSGADLHMFDPDGTWLGIAGQYSVFWFEGRLLAVYGGSETYFDHVNSIGSTSMMTDHAGNPIEDVLFTPWGDVLTASGSGGWSFAKMPYDDLKTTTDLTPARVFGPNFGRWFSPDPLGQDAADPSDPQSWNMYAYVRNNPTTLTDPSGERYQVCQTDTNGNKINCGDISDEQFSQFVEENKNTLVFTGNGSVLQNGTVIGSYQQTSVDPTPGLTAVGTGTQMAAPIVKPLFDATMGFLMMFGPGMLASSYEMPVALGALSAGLTVDDILQGAAPEGGSRSGIYSKPGGITQAKDDFNALAGGKPEARGPVQIKQLADGRRAVLRTDPSTWSSDGRPAVDIQPQGGGYKQISIRYN